jgi:hypothetical protein
MNFIIKYALAPLIYFLIITPISLVFKLLRINTLDLNPDQKQSFWKNKVDNDNYEKQS